MIYLRRLIELIAAAFIAGAVPVIAEQGLSKAALSGAVVAGALAVYGLIAKNLGDDKDRPTVL